jgi:hypothetical protein
VTLAAFLLICKLACAPAFQVGGQVIVGLQQEAIVSGQVQIAYYKALRAYYQTRRCCCGRRKTRRR